ncbi:MAG: hypothetical protein P8X42_04400 [Calditrichaceae bacterium]|jgi:hypothetical protein
MSNESNGLLNVILSYLFFPMHFQNSFISFAWGADETFWFMIGKRIFILLPVMAIILALWLTIFCALTVIVRHDRKNFVITLLMTWFDLGKSIASFWGGIFKFAFTLVIGIFSMLKVIILGIWSMIQEILFMPLRLVKNIGQNVVSSNIPWIAVTLTIFWCIIEATIFTYVTTPLVMDTFSNITGEALSITFIRIPLYIFLLFIVLGSYAVLSTMIDVVKEKNVSKILGIVVIEIIVLMVEVLFLYREFVDSLVPWLAQYSEGFELGLFWTLAISVFVWFGIRSLSWFLFASHGTPTIMAVIQGRGLQSGKKRTQPKARLVDISFNFMDIIKKDTEWIQQKSEDVLAAFMLPPLQVIAAALNFLTLLFVGKHIFDLPFKSLEDIKETSKIIESHSAPSEAANKA